MSWQDASVAVTGTVMVIVLGSVLIWQIFRTAQVALIERGQLPMKARHLHSIEETAEALWQPRAQLEARGEQVDAQTTKNGEDA